MKQTLLAAILVLSALFINNLFAQTLNDGPIQLRVDLRTIRVQYNISSSSDFSLDCGSLCGSFPASFRDDELTFKVWARDNANISGLTWQGGTCLQASLPMSGGADISPDFNTTLFSQTYAGANVPQFVDIRIDAWEDDVPSDFAFLGGVVSCGNSGGTRCSFETNVACISLIGWREGDDFRCDANPFRTGLNYRLGPPCQEYNHGYVTGTGCTNNFYRPEINTFWRYSKGTACTPAAAIDLGTITSGFSVSHFNSNECYSNVFPGAPGNDVYYTFDITNPVGVTITLTSNCPGPGQPFNVQLNLLENNCTVDSTRNGTCTSPAVIAKALCQAGRYYVVVDGATAADLGTFTLTVEENPSFSLNATVATTAVLCTGNSNGSVEAVVTGGVSPYTYQWSGGLPAVDSIGGLAAGSYTVTITDAATCQVTATGTIGSPAPLTATATGSPVSCGGATNGSATVTPSGGQAPYTYAWNTNPPQFSFNAVSLAAGTYSVTVTDFNGCTTSATATVQATTTIVVNTLAVNNVTCNGANDGSIDLDVTGGQAPYGYSWSNGLPATQNQTGLAPGTYTVTVTDIAGCLEVLSFVIREPDPLVSQINNVRNASCQSSTDGAVDLGVAGGTLPYTYLWSDNSTFEELFGAAPGSYDVTVTDANGCTTTNTATVNGPADSIVSSITKTDANCTQNITGTADLTVSGGNTPYSFFWSNFSTSQNVTGLEAGTYSVVITDASGCVKIDTVTIAELTAGGCGNDTVISRDSSAYVAIPNAFSPDGNTINDRFQFWLNKTSNVEVYIYNRFGSLVYYNANQAASDGWDGQHNGNDAQEGTYVYMVNIVYQDGTEEMKTGSITLIR